MCDHSIFIASSTSFNRKFSLQREKADLASSITVLKRFQEKLRQKDCCPLCHRDFITKEEVSFLIEEVSVSITFIPIYSTGEKSWRNPYTAKAFHQFGTDHHSTTLKWWYFLAHVGGVEGMEEFPGYQRITAQSPTSLCLEWVNESPPPV